MANDNGCCALALPGIGGGSFNVPGVDGSGGGAGSGGDIVDRIAQAVDAAIHGGEISSARNSNGSATGSRGGGNVIEFPMVDPYLPIRKTRVPVAGLNAFPRVADIANFSYRTRVFNARGDEDTGDEGMSGLGFTWGDFGNVLPNPQTTMEYPTGISLPSTGPSNLQLILDAISRTLPATISAAKKQPYYDPAQSSLYNAQIAQAGYYGQPGSNIGSQLGGAVGNIGDTFGNIVAQHPFLVLAGGAALILLFMSPPKRR